MALRDAAAVDDFSAEQKLVVIVFERGGRPLGLLAAEPVEMIETEFKLDEVTLRQKGIAGSAIIHGTTTMIINMLELSDGFMPDRAGVDPEVEVPQVAGEHRPTALLAEDSDWRASYGRFSSVEISRGLSDEFRLKYFRPAGAEWQIRDEIRAMASFKALNLMEGFSHLGHFDIIFCRNVAIYFADSDRVSLFGQIEKALERDGYLVLGSMESLSAACPQFESKRHLRAVYYQLKSTPGATVPESKNSNLVSSSR